MVWSLNSNCVFYCSALFIFWKQSPGQLWFSCISRRWGINPINSEIERVHQKLWFCYRFPPSPIIANVVFRLWKLVILFDTFFVTFKSIYIFILCFEDLLIYTTLFLLLPSHVSLLLLTSLLWNIQGFFSVLLVFHDLLKSILFWKLILFIFRLLNAKNIIQALYVLYKICSNTEKIGFT